MKCASAGGWWFAACLRPLGVGPVMLSLNLIHKKANVKDKQSVFNFVAFYSTLKPDWKEVTKRQMLFRNL